MEKFLIAALVILATATATEAAPQELLPCNSPILKKALEAKIGDLVPMGLPQNGATAAIEALEEVEFAPSGADPVLAAI